MITLKKKVGDAYMEVIFEGSAPESEEEKQIEIPQNYELVQHEQNSNVHDFTVTICKTEDGNGQGIIAEYAASGSKATMCYINFAKNVRAS